MSKKSKNTRLAPIDIVATVDQLGLLKAQIAELELQEKNLASVLKATGRTEFEGTIFRATVTVADRHTLDMAAVRDKLSAQFIAAHTNTTTVTTVRVVARGPAAAGELLKVA